MKRIITKFRGTHEGPLLIAFGGMHGNEPAGVEAIRLMGKMLDVEPITNPEFEYHGYFLGILGNKKAFKVKKRFITRDLNRSWVAKKVERLQHQNPAELEHEDREIHDIMTCIWNAINEFNPSKIIVLDLHTTSSKGGIFSIATDDPESLRIAVELNAPVIKGMLDGIKGTVLHYFNTDNFGINTTPVAFESGQHDEPLSVNRAIAALTNCMKIIGSISEKHVENQHNYLLNRYSEHLPKVTKLVTKHGIKEGDDFQMLPGYKNFQKVKKGELLARDRKGNITSPADGIILMPLYQKQGEDGFFIVKEEAY